MTSFSSLSCFFTVCPKYSNFSLIFSSVRLVASAFSSNHLFCRLFSLLHILYMRCGVHSIHLESLYLFSSCFFNVHLSHPHIVAANVLRSLIMYPALRWFSTLNTNRKWLFGDRVNVAAFAVMTPRASGNKTASVTTLIASRDT